MSAPYEQICLLSGTSDASCTALFNFDWADIRRWLDKLRRAQQVLTANPDVAYAGFTYAPCFRIVSYGKVLEGQAAVPDPSTAPVYKSQEHVRSDYSSATAKFDTLETVLLSVKLGGALPNMACSRHSARMLIGGLQVFTDVSVPIGRGRTENVSVHSNCLSYAQLLVASFPLEEPEMYDALMTELIEADTGLALDILENGVTIHGISGGTVDVYSHVSHHTIQALIHCEERPVRQRARLLLGRSLANQRSNAPGRPV